MTIKPTIKGYRTFVRAIDEIEVIIKNSSGNIVKEIAKKTLGRLISRSPIVTGRYVSNHKVNDFTSSNISQKFTEEQDNRKAATGFAIANGFNVIGRLENPKKITISNTVDYAQNVETGWDIGNKHVSGYFVYTHTTNDMLEEAPWIISVEDAKAQAKLNGL